MLKKFKAANLLLLTFLVLQLLAVFLPASSLYVIVRTTFIPLLTFFFYHHTKLSGRFHKRLFTGLVFAWIGDLLFTCSSGDQHLNLYGVFAFILCYLWYTRAFYLDFRSAQELDKRGARWAIVVCSISAMAFYTFVRPTLGEFRIPVMVATFIGSLLLMMAVFRNQRVNKESFNLIFAGCIVLLLSAMMCCYFIFVRSFSFSLAPVLACYMIAQYLIVCGGISRKLLHQTTT